MKIIIFLSLVLLLFISAQSINGKIRLEPQILAEWEISFFTNQGLWFQSPMSVSRQSDGRIVAAFLDKTWIKFTDGKIKSKILVLTGESPYGRVKFEAKFTGKRLLGQWTIGDQIGSIRGESLKVDKRKIVSAIEVFDFVKSKLDKQFYDPEFNGADWKKISSDSRQQALTAKTDAELVTIIRTLFEKIGTSHLEFYRETSALPKTNNKPKAVNRNAGEAVPVDNAPITWKKLAPTIGYLKIKRFEEGKEAVDLVDQAFAEIGSLSSLIIDFRDNEGGTLSIGMRLGDYIFGEMRPLGFLATRRGLDRLGIKSLTEIRATNLPSYTEYNVDGFLKLLESSGIVLLKTGGRAAKPYRGQIALLINERSGSATEAFAAVIKESGGATLIGQRTAGAMLSSTKIDVPGDWTLLLPEADFVTTGGMRVEGQGVEPHILVKNEKTEDSVLKRAIQFLNENNSTSK